MKTCSIVENICVYGDPTKNYCVALIVPTEKALGELAASLGIEGEFEALCSNKVIEKAVLKELSEHAKKSRLAKFEVPAAITLCKGKLKLAKIFNLFNSIVSLFQMFGAPTWVL